MNNKPTFITLFIAGIIAGLIMIGVFAPIQQGYDIYMVNKRRMAMQAEAIHKREHQWAEIQEVQRLSLQRYYAQALPMAARFFAWRGRMYVI